MKKTGIGLVLALLLLGCGENDKINDGTETVGDSLSSTDGLYMDVESEEQPNEDTLEAENVLLYFEPLEQQVFDNADTLNFVTYDSSGIRRDGQKWLFTLDNGQEKNLLTDDTTDSDNYQLYFFAGKIPAAGQWLFQGAYYESGGYILVDMHSGKTIGLKGFPVVSPDKRYIMSVSSDLIAGMDDNGLDLFEVKDGTISELISVELVTRGPSDIRWLSGGEVAVKENYLKDSEEQIRYVKLKIKMK